MTPAKVYNTIQFNQPDGSFAGVPSEVEPGRACKGPAPSLRLQRPRSAGSIPAAARAQDSHAPATQRIHDGSQVACSGLDLSPVVSRRGGWTTRTWPERARREKSAASPTDATGIQSFSFYHQCEVAVAASRLMGLSLPSRNQ